MLHLKGVQEKIKQYFCLIVLAEAQYLSLIFRDCHGHNLGQ